MHSNKQYFLISPALFILTFFSTLSFATNYRIGPSQTYAKLQDVCSLLKAGDTVFVDGNTTYPGDVVFTKAGSKQSPVVIKGVRISGKRPVISGGTNTVHFSSDYPYTSGADNYIFEGFEITGGSVRGIFHQADNLTIRDVAVHDCPQHGILGADQGSGSCLLEFVEVYNCGSGDRYHQIYMATDEVNHPASVFRMQHCYLHDGVGGNNVKSRAERNEIYYNWIEGAYYHELELIGPDPGGAPDGWTPRLKREDSDVVGNVLWKKGSNSTFSVTRIGGDATGESHGRYRFVNNTVICGTSAVFRCFDSLQSVEMHNNVFYREGGGINMMRTAEANWTEGTAVIAGSKNWVYQGAQNIPAQWTGTVLGTNPGFADFANNKLQPANGSALINTGAGSVQSAPGFEFINPLFPPACQPPSRSVNTNPLARTIEQVIDIGAYEFNATGIVNNKTAQNGITNLSIRPNPFAHSAAITYYRNIPGEITLTIFSTHGQKIKSIYKKWQEKGKHTMLWDGLDADKNNVTNGIYIITVKTATNLKSITLVKNH